MPFYLHGDFLSDEKTRTICLVDEENKMNVIIDDLEFFTTENYNITLEHPGLLEIRVMKMLNSETVVLATSKGIMEVKISTGIVVILLPGNFFTVEVMPNHLILLGSDAHIVLFDYLKRQIAQCMDTGSVGGCKTLSESAGKYWFSDCTTNKFYSLEAQQRMTTYSLPNEQSVVVSVQCVKNWLVILSKVGVEYSVTIGCLKVSQEAFEKSLIVQELPIYCTGMKVIETDNGEIQIFYVGRKFDEPHGTKLVKLDLMSNMTVQEITGVKSCSGFASSSLVEDCWLVYGKDCYQIVK
jgi:hypothetical protein